MRQENEEIREALKRRLDPVRVSSGLWGRIEKGVERSRRARRVEVTILALVAFGGLAFVGARLGTEPSGSVALAPGTSPQVSVSPSGEPSPTPSASMTSPTAEPDGMKHFVSPGGSLEFDYPEGWVEDPGTTDVGGTFYSRDHPDEKRQPGDMKLEFAIHENSEKDDLSDIEARECTREPALEAAVQCERREINGRTWVWQAVQTTDYFDRSYVLSIQTIVKDRIYSLAGYILRGEDVSDERIQILEKILLTAKANG